MSDYLKRDIRDRFKESHKKAKPELEIKGNLGDQIYNTYIGPKISVLQEAASDAFGDVFDTDQLFAKETTIHSQVALTTSSFGWDSEKEENTIISDLDESYNLKIPLSTERLMPRGHDSRGMYSNHITFNFDRHEDKQINYICELVEYNYKLRATRDNAVGKVSDLLDKFTTLNQALKAWPALSKLVDPEKLSKVHEKQERKRTQDIQKEMADKVVVDNDLNKTILSASLIGDSDE
jgi:hypothetical protein